MQQRILRTLSPQATSVALKQVTRTLCQQVLATSSQLPTNAGKEMSATTEHRGWRELSLSR